MRHLALTIFALSLATVCYGMFLGGGGGFNPYNDEPRIGGLGPEKPGYQAPGKLQSAIATTIRDEFERKTGNNPPVFQLISYTEQVVAGTNYFVKVRIGRRQFVHLRIYQPLPYTGLDMSLEKVDENKRFSDRIEYF